MIGRIGIQDFKVDCIIGIHPDERSTAQTVLVDMDISYDISQAVQHDEISYALDYSRMAEIIAEHLKWQRYHLLETACAGLIEMIRRAHPEEILGITLRIRKIRTSKTFYASLSWP